MQNLQERVICFVDGFNLYHSINNLKMPHLKWVNPIKLASVFIRPKSQQLTAVYYFSAYADWLPDSRKRHVQYVKAITAAGAKPVMGRFKEKDRQCKKCNLQWKGHEEKETDVNIALAMLELAYKNEYDHAFLISNDSDMVPAINMIRRNFPNKKVTTIAPPRYNHSNELINASSAKAKIRVEHIERCLLEDTYYDAGGNIIAVMPAEYALLVNALAT